MRDEIARALVVMWLQPDKRREFQEMELRLPSDRWWRSSEILSQLRIPRTGCSVASEEIAEMERVHGEFYKRILGPLTLHEDELHPKMCCDGTAKTHECSMFNCHHPADPGLTTEAQKMQLWDDYAVEHYRPPHVGGSIEASLKFA